MRLDFEAEPPDEVGTMEMGESTWIVGWRTIEVMPGSDLMLLARATYCWELGVPPATFFIVVTGARETRITFLLLWPDPDWRATMEEGVITVPPLALLMSLAPFFRSAFAAAATAAVVVTRWLR